MERHLLSIENLRVYFHTYEGVIPAVDGVTLNVNKGETLGVVGESGCGKSVTARTIMRLVPTPPARIESGTILFKDEDLLRKSEKQMQKIRGSQISMVFQDPMTSLNPVFTVGDQIIQKIKMHKKLSYKDARDCAIENFKLVGISSPVRRINQYPHQLSGGLRQRVMIAMALSCDPQLLLADEPTTALDVTIQAQILELMAGLKDELDMSMIMITHDLGVIAEVAERVVVMYAGKVVEEAPVNSLFDSPYHPYTIGLLDSTPRLDKHGYKMQGIKGMVPDLRNLPSGCRFNPRCRRVMDRCSVSEPPLSDIGGRKVACWLYNEGHGS